MNFKKIIFLLFLFFSVIFTIPVSAKKNVNLYFFHGDGCPHCALESDFLKELEKENKNVNIVKYEVWYNEDNSILLDKVKETMEIKENGVPITIIGSTAIVGYSDSLEKKIERAVNFYSENEHKDIVSLVIDGKDDIKLEDDFLKEETETDEDTTFEIPIIGKVNAKDLSLPTVAALIGLVDGFNPCAMWVLLFLISMLISMHDKKKMWILGFSFLFTSAFVYMLIMLSWLQIAVNVTTSIIFRNIIALVALIGSFINLKNFFTTKDSGCHVVKEKRRKKIFSKIQKFTSEKKLYLAILGVVALAISVNIVELACSAGLPLVFTQILALNKVTGLMSFIYTLIYIAFFLLDDIVIFSIAMITMNLTGISTKYNKYSHLVGGIIMLIVGLLLLFKPEWLMFNFN